jgi:uncharacterized protein YbaP (TraB family)
MATPNRWSWRAFALAFSLCLAACSRPAAQQTAPPAQTLPPAASTAPAPAVTPAKEAAAKWRPFLWTIETKEGKRSHLMGTIHIPDERVTTFPKSIESALAASDVLKTEVTLDESTVMKTMALAVMPKGKTLQGTLPAPLYARLSTHFAAKGLPLSRLPELKVWAIATQIPLLDQLSKMGDKKPQDAQLSARAKAQNKEVGAVETLEEQISVFDALTEREQIHMLEKTLDEVEKGDGHADPLEELIRAYISGDDAVIRAQMLRWADMKDPVDARMMKLLITDRNVRMATRIEKDLNAKPARSYFFAVGAAHTVGDDGLAAVLAKRGFKVTRVSE